MAKKKANMGVVIVGLILLFFGGFLDGTIIGLPEGLSVQGLGVLLIAFGSGVF